MKHTILLCPPLFAAALQTLLKKNPLPWRQQVPAAQIPHHRAGTDMGECASVCKQRQDHLATSIVTGVLSPTVCYCTQHASVCLSVSRLELKDRDKRQKWFVSCVKNPVSLTWKKIFCQIRLYWEHRCCSQPAASLQCDLISTVPVRPEMHVCFHFCYINGFDVCSRVTVLSFTIVS